MRYFRGCSGDERPERILCLLPDTGRDGAWAFAGRRPSSVDEFLSTRGCATEGRTTARATTFPGDEAQLDELGAEVNLELS
jgi:hypothetical protein